MARKHEAVEWLKKGCSPSKIAQQMGVTTSTVMSYLYNQVGEGKIRRSDITFSIDEETRDEIESVVSRIETTYWFSVFMELKKSGKSIDTSDLRVYLNLRDARVDLGDMYEFIRDIEISLHDLVKSKLTSRYEKDWWRKGIPPQIRAECAAAWEKDPEPASEPYAYTTFIHLGEILKKQWFIFEEILSHKLASNRRGTIQRLEKLNHIRNSVMHPVKGTKLTEKDFSFVREFRKDFNL